MADAHERSYGPWLVALGAALWGTETYSRKELIDPAYGIVFREDVMVFLEHAILVVLFLPLILPRLGELRRVSRRTIAWLVFSGIAGSAVGTVFFSMALAHGNATVVNVVLNLQPVLSTSAAWLIFGDRLAPRFFVWAPIAVIAGVLLSVEHPTLLFSSFQDAGLDSGTGYALICALFWGLSTVAGRGVMVEMSLELAAGLRLVVGLISMTVLCAVNGSLTPDLLWPATAAAHAGHVAWLYFVLVTISGGIPLLIYFAGLRRTRASTAGYFEMCQTLAALAVSWGFFGEGLTSGHQIAAGIVLIGAVAMVQRAQQATAA